jgi:acyl-CoA thioesterase YciA
MSQVDIAGSIPAIELAKGRVATVAVNSFTFKHPVMIGDVVSFYAEVVRVGRTSITVDVEVYARAAYAARDGEGNRSDVDLCGG